MATTQILKWMQSKWIKKNATNLQLIGEGGFGCVFSFTKKETSMKKALKVIEYEKVKSETKSQIDVNSWYTEAVQEILNLQSLGDCEFILRLEDDFFDKEYKCVFLVTELAKTSLYQHVIDSKRELPKAEIVKIIHSVLSGIQFAHTRKIVHRDIKTQNILITESGSFLICDWGIARKMRNSATQTHNTVAKGTDNYLPPEVYDVVEKKTDQANLFKSDLYSAGLVFLVCCGLPETKLKFIDKTEEGEHNSKHSEYLEKYVVPKIPEIKELITNLTHFDAKKRFDIDQAMRWCANSKIFSHFNTSSVKVQEIDLDDKKKIVPVILILWIFFLYF
jgi:serine/threonine protein kinase